MCVLRMRLADAMCADDVRMCYAHVLCACVVRMCYAHVLCACVVRMCCAHVLCACVVRMCSANALCENILLYENILPGRIFFVRDSNNAQTIRPSVDKRHAIFVNNCFTCRESHPRSSCAS
eukprot:GHVS01105003.1.p1 GENE.GHVS01105003.1~~GHVS01105003.1.p1  ORF type:complete len:121 (+),score=13.55 GHVS01105003.1:526-888(+)